MQKNPNFTFLLSKFLVLCRRRKIYARFFFWKEIENCVPATMFSSCLLLLWKMLSILVGRMLQYLNKFIVVESSNFFSVVLSFHGSILDYRACTLTRMNIVQVVFHNHDGSWIWLSIYFGISCSVSIVTNGKLVVYLQIVTVNQW